jgi:hypothetical protein
LPEGWKLRERYPFYDGPFIEWELAGPSGEMHRLTIDRAFFLDGDGYRFLYEWVGEKTDSAVDAKAGSW